MSGHLVTQRSSSSLLLIPHPIEIAVDAATNSVWANYGKIIRTSLLSL